MRITWSHALAAVAGASVAAAGCGSSKSGGEDEGAAQSAAEDDEGSTAVPELPTPEVEVAKTTIALDLPAVPVFVAPEPLAGGAHTPLEMRLLGAEYLDTDVVVEGHVVWIYDCAASLDPELSAAEAREVISEHPERCVRPHFLLGDAADTPVDDAILVVEVPRPLRPDEKKGLTEAQIAELPPVPELAVGKRVRVAGRWATKSPRGFASDDGLLVYERLAE